MAQIEIGKSYSQAQLTKLIGTSQTTFIGRREEFMAHLRAAYVFDIREDGRGFVYTFKEKIGEYVPVPRKRKELQQISY